jgi:hypothetical protein
MAGASAPEWESGEMEIVLGAVVAAVVSASVVLLSRPRTVAAGGHAPEGVAVDAGGNVYAGLEDGRVVRLGAGGGPPEVFAETGGRPLAAIAYDGGAAVADPFARTADVVERLDSIRPTRETFAEAKSRVPSADGFVRSFRDGFSRAADGRLLDDDGEGASDSRLMMQIGMLLGFAYLGFLTVWFWATRLRPNPGS